MLQRPFLLVVPSLLLLGCASARSMDVIDGCTIDSRTIVADSGASSPAVDAELVAQPSTVTALEAQPVTGAVFPSSASAPAAEESLHTSRFTVKGGYWGATEDAIDDGYLVGLSWMRFFSKLFALELEAGYMDADGTDSGVDFDVWSIPVMVNGRLNVPIWVLDLYGGLGIGTFYYDAEASGAASADDDGFLWAGDAFVGATINLADAIALGLELKYYLTDDIDDYDEGLDAYALLLTLGFSR
jgi:hypothetical protein